MNDELIDIRRPLAVSPSARVELGQDGTLHVLAGPITLHLERAFCEELTTTLARAMVRLVQEDPAPARSAAGRASDARSCRHLRVVVMEHDEPTGSAVLFAPDERAAGRIDSSYEGRLAGRPAIASVAIPSDPSAPRSPGSAPGATRTRQGDRS